MADVNLLLGKDNQSTDVDWTERYTSEISSLLDVMDMDSSTTESNSFDVDNLVVNPDDLLPPVAKLEKYANSDIVFNRQVVARNLLETLRTVKEDRDDVNALLNILCRLSDDYEPSVRAELMEQIPHIAAFCSEYSTYLKTITRQYLVPTIIKYLTDINNQVRKTSQATLLVMAEQNLIEKDVLKEQICPLILQLTEADHMDDHRTEAVTMMSKMAPLVGKEATESLFLQRFTILCLDASFHVRKMCASSFGDFCGIVGRDTTEKHLLSTFYYLCEDGVWGVRKACAEVFMPVSCVCCMEIRRKDLAPVFLNLLCDQSRWVRMAAFQALGPFISTFAEPSKTGLYYSKDGIITSMNVESSTQIISSTSSDACVVSSASESVKSPAVKEETSDVSVVFQTCSDSSTFQKTDEVNNENISDFHTVIKLHPHPNIHRTHAQNTSGRSEEKESNFVICDQNVLEISSVTSHNSDKTSLCSPIPSQSDGNQELSSKLKDESSFLKNNLAPHLQKKNVEPPLTVTASQHQLHVHVDNESAFNHFQYWRIPVPDLELDIKIEEGKATNVHVRAHVCKDDHHHKIYASDLNVKVIPPHSEVTQCSTVIPCSVESVTTQLAKTHLEPKSLASPTPSIVMPPDMKKAYIHTMAMNAILNVGKKDKGNSCMQSEDNVQAFNSRLLMCDKVFSDIKNAQLDLSSPEAKSLLERLNPECPTNLLCPYRLQVSCHDQDIVPPKLLIYYLSMTDSIRAETIDAEIARHCAYSLPAVALTLGRKYWPCLKSTYEALASDMQGFIPQWKARRTLASSMHQLAVILGPELAAQDLLPVFSGFLKDLDEVRIGILQHLSEFLKALNPPERQEFLPRIAEFLSTDNDRNWRFRLTLAEQLIPTAELYGPNDMKEYLMPLALSLVRDKVCEVRLVSVQVVAIMMKTLSQSSNPLLTKSVLAELAENFITAPKWLLRQTYVYLSEQFIQEESLPLDQFVQDVLPHLLYLCWDRVANVRLVLARCLSRTLWPLEYFTNTQSPHHELVLQALHTLQSDVDNDVRYYANLVVKENDAIDSKELPV